MSGRRRITQATFDEVVAENVEDLGMGRDEAIADARAQFEAQGVDLSNIVDDCDGPGRRVLALVHRLNAALDESSESEMGAVLESLKAECTDPVAFDLAAGEGLVGAAAAIAQRFKNNADLVATSLSILKMLMSSANAKAMLPEQGAKALMECISGNVDDIDVQRLGLTLVGTTMAGHEPHKIAFHDAGLTPHLRIALERHQGDPAAFSAACRAIQRYVSDDDRRPGVHPHTFGRARELAEGDHAVLPILFVALREQLNRPEQVATICATMKTLAVTDAICGALSEQVLDLLVQAMNMYPQDERIARHAFAMIKLLSRNDSVKVEICNSACLASLLTLMGVHGSNDKVAVQGLGVLHSISLRQPDLCLKLADSGVIQLVTSAMRRHAGNVAVQRSAIGTLRNLVSNHRTKSLIPLILDDDAESLIRRAHASHEKCRDVAFAALRDLGLPYEAFWEGSDK
ncbi:Armadillo repeat-containing domain-containing protein [Plasmodiophora brassicae]|uniref:Armadillo repeat-containing domain-containing protein n=1 Tax=Plasmodiophora brassicae TaxID=37360 RepID=A0A0G4IM04_PLABS|nr:hypothetical protein PBRA_004957 [Plasmodiophora brassicae]SPQ99224.1 unnamed protein product [Plasmodiophora brassicae]